MSKTSDSSSTTTVLANPDSREPDPKFHRSRSDSVVWSPCGAYDPTSESHVDRMTRQQAEDLGLDPCGNCYPETRSDLDEDDDVDRGEGIIADGGQTLPAGVEASHHNPEAYVVRCHSCGSEAVSPSRPETDSRECDICGRSLGVTPVRYVDDVPDFWIIESDVGDDSVEESAVPDGGYRGSTDAEVREAVESLESEVDRGEGPITDGGRDVAAVDTWVDVRDDRELVRDLDDDGIPLGWRRDHHSPDEYRLRCPDCGAVDMTEEPPKGDTRECIDCDRLRGVVPVSRRGSEVCDSETTDHIEDLIPAITRAPPEPVDWGSLTPAVREVPRSHIDVEFDEDGAASEEFLTAVADGGVDVE